MAKSERGFFSGGLDKPIDALYQVLDIEDADSVRDLAKSLGNAVVKRIHDWTEATSKGGFAADIRWRRSDGVERGRMVGRQALANIAGVIERTSDEQTSAVSVVGTLVGIDVDARTFHLSMDDEDPIRGKLSESYPVGDQVKIPAIFNAEITKVEKYFYATDKRDVKYFLDRLIDTSVSPPGQEKSPPK